MDEAGIQQAGALSTAIISSAIQNKGAKDRQDDANKKNLEFWGMQNEYNHPSSQMARLREANLNPNLIYGTSGNQSVGNAEAIAPSKASPHEQRDWMQHLNAFAQGKNIGAQTDNLREQNTVLQQEATLKALQASESESRTAMNKFDLGLKSELRTNSLEFANENVRRMRADATTASLMAVFNDKTLADRIEAIKYGVENAKASLKGTQLDNQLKAYERDLNKLGLTKNDSRLFRILGNNWLDMKDYYNENLKWKPRQ